MSNPLITAIGHYAKHPDNPVALETTEGNITYRDLFTRVMEMREQLQAAAVRHVGILCENGPLWVVVQLAALDCGIPLTPIPSFFSSAQQRHVITQSGVDCLFTDNPAYVPDLNSEFAPHHSIVQAFYRSIEEVSLPNDTALVTYTSGTTGQPKGVCLSLEHLLQISQDLTQLIADHNLRRHLCLMPLPVLLENVAGFFVPLLLGRTVGLYPTVQLGLSGSSQLDIGVFTRVLNTWRSDSLIVTPELLKVLVCLLAGEKLRHRPRYIAVGGSRVSISLLQQATGLGLSVCEGYGLSECGSVVTLNTPDYYRLGSVGKPLPHCRVEIARDGEIWVYGSQSLGYLGSTQRDSSRDGVATGDLGYFDNDGFLYIHGRKKNHIITGFGRNVAPEWPEAELCGLASIRQACVVGDGQTFLTAIIYPMPGVSEICIQQDLDQINQRLPDYAQISAWIPAKAPFSTANGQLTNNGRLKREVIAEVYRHQIQKIYLSQPAKTG